MATWCGTFAAAVHAVHVYWLLPLPDVDLLRAGVPRLLCMRPLLSMAT